MPTRMRLDSSLYRFANVWERAIVQSELDVRTLATEHQNRIQFMQTSTFSLSPPRTLHRRRHRATRLANKFK